MFNKEEVRQQIIQYFKAVGSGENIVQAIKQALFLNQEFSPLVLFQMLSNGKQRITKNDWKKYLIKRNITFSDKQIKYFFRHNHFGQQITLNQFLQGIIPYNADVVREFKSKYLQSLQIQELNPQIDFIFAQLMKNWIDFFRNLIEIRAQISRNVTRRQIQHLIKEDLVLYSKPRQARKFHQNFQQRKFQLSFHQLRKFLQLWISSKQVIHQFCLLNVKRHIKSDNPFVKIAHRNRKNNRSRSRSASQSLSASRSVSRNKQPQSKRKQILSTDRKLSVKQKQAKNKDPNEEQQQYLQNSDKQRNNAYPEQRFSKYDQYKKQLLGALAKQKQKQRYTNQQNSSLRNHYRPQDRIQSNRKLNFDNNAQQSNRKKQNQNPLTNEAAKRAKQTQEKKYKNNYVQNNAKQQEKQVEKKNRFSKSQEGSLISKMFQQIILKQDRLQKLRKQLAKCNDFTVLTLFKIIDHNNKGYISNQGIKAFTKQDQYYQNMINYYTGEKNKLKIQQFSGIFRPLSKQLNEALDSRPQTRGTNNFKKQTMRLILQILKLQNEMHNNLDIIRKKIRKDGVSPKGLFQYIDTNKKGYITSQDVKQLIDQSNIHCEPKDLKCFMKLFHKKIDERISLKEFLSFIDF